MIRTLIALALLATAPALAGGVTAPRARARKRAATGRAAVAVHLARARRPPRARSIPPSARDRPAASGARGGDAIAATARACFRSPPAIAARARIGAHLGARARSGM